MCFNFHFSMMQKVKLVVALEVLGLIGVYAYYKKVEHDVAYRKKLFDRNSSVLEGSAYGDCNSICSF